MASPEPKEVKFATIEAGMSFPDAMKVIVEGGVITRVGWMNDDVCQLKGEWLSVRRDGVWHRWLINDGDLLATDWTVSNLDIKSPSLH